MDGWEVIFKLFSVCVSVLVGHFLFLGASDLINNLISFLLAENEFVRVVFDVEFLWFHYGPGDGLGLVVEGQVLGYLFGRSWLPLVLLKVELSVFRRISLLANHTEN